MTWGTTDFELGGSIGLVARETLALVVSDDRAIRDTLWALVAVDAPIDEILEGLSGHGLRNLPSFVIVRVEGERSVRVVVRGSASVRLVTDDGEVVVESRSAMTWVEREVRGVSSVELSATEFEPAAGRRHAASEFPFHVLAGSVPASSMRRSLVVADRHAEAAQDGGWSVPVGAPPLTVTDEEADVVPVADVGADPAPEGPPEPAVDVPDSPSGADGSIEESPPDAAPEPSVTGASEVDASLSDPGDASPDRNGSPATGEPLPPPAYVTPTPFDSGATLLPSDLHRLQWPADEQASVDHGPEAVQGAPVLPGGSAGVVEETSLDVADDDGYDHLFGHTIARSVQQAAVQAPGDGHDPTPSGLIDAIPGGGAVTSDVPQLGDHDGHTISRAELERMRSAGGGLSGAVPAAPVVGPTVQARLCVTGHPNPTHLTVCRSCGGPMSPNPPVAVARPVLGVLRFSNGLVVHLDRPQLIGRSPKVEGHVGGEIPNLVRLDEAGQGVSRRHVAVHLENWQVLLEDLNSANGTIVALPGRPARRLIAGEPIALEPGTVIDLGGEMSIAFEASR